MTRLAESVAFVFFAWGSASPSSMDLRLAAGILSNLNILKSEDEKAKAERR